jgi:hypothetical protein
MRERLDVMGQNFKLRHHPKLITFDMRRKRLLLTVGRSLRLVFTTAKPPLLCGLCANLDRHTQRTNAPGKSLQLVACKRRKARRFGLQRRAREGVQQYALRLDAVP